MQARASETVAVLRELLAAIDNAEAADPSAAPPVEHGVIAGGVAGLGAGEVPRRALDPAAVATIVEREIREREEAAARYVELGRRDQAEALQRQIATLTALG